MEMFGIILSIPAAFCSSLLYACDQGMMPLTPVLTVPFMIPTTSIMGGT
jgi:hypothetical protein